MLAKDNNEQDGDKKQHSIIFTGKALIVTNVTDIRDIYQRSDSVPEKKWKKGSSWLFEQKKKLKRYNSPAKFISDLYWLKKKKPLKLEMECSVYFNPPQCFKNWLHYEVNIRILLRYKTSQNYFATQILLNKEDRDLLKPIYIFF